MADEDLTRVAKLEHSPILRGEVLVPAQSTEVKFALHIGFIALAFAILSMSMCVGPAIVEYFLGLEPDSLDVNPHAQAVMMMVFGLCSLCMPCGETEDAIAAIFPRRLAPLALPSCSLHSMSVITLRWRHFPTRYSS
jgi:hypothetical protein